jgi:hypothetical protein
MELGIKRLVWVSVAALLTAGVWVTAAGAVRNVEPKAPPKVYSDSDCETIQNIEVMDSSGGYWGKTARNAAAAFSDAAQDVDNKKLRKAMNTLAGVWRTVGRETSPIAAAKVTLKAGKKYGNALGTFTKATVTCASQEISSAFVETTTTTEPLSDGSSSSTSNPDSGSSSSSSSSDDGSSSSSSDSGQ